MHTNQLLHPWELATTWTHAHPAWLHRHGEAGVAPASEPDPSDVESGTATLAFISTQEVMLGTAAATHWWNGPTKAAASRVHRAFTLPAPRTLPENRSHYYPARNHYLERSAMSRAMYHL